MNFNTDYKITKSMLDRAEENKDKKFNESVSFNTVVPVEINRDTKLKPNAKLVFATILTLSQAYGACWCSNEWLGKYFSVTPVSISRLINQLVETGYVVAKYAQTNSAIKKRFLFINYNKIPSYVKITEEKQSENLCKQDNELDIKIQNQTLSETADEVKKDVSTEQNKPLVKAENTPYLTNGLITKMLNVSVKTDVENGNRFNNLVYTPLTEKLNRINKKINKYNNITCPSNIISQSNSHTVSDVLNSFPNVKEFNTSFQNQNFERSQKTQNETKMLNTTSQKSKKSKSTFSKTHFKKTDYDECRQLLFANRDILKSQNKFVDETPYPFAIINNWIKSCFVNYGVEKTKQGIKNSTKNDWLVNTAQYKFNALFSKKVFHSLLSNTQGLNQSDKHHVIDFHNQDWDLAF